jgi:serine/threonine-protein kinase RsbW/stage II sporulation protein AB (anti-sigma F factor)
LVALRENLSESYPAVRETVPAVRRAVASVAQAAGAPANQLDSVRLAVSEAVTNAVIHAYRGCTGQIHVTAAIASGELWVLVADDGCGFQSPSPQPGQGWGLALIAGAADSFEIATRSNGGTELRMQFAIVPEPGEAG